MSVATLARRSRNRNCEEDTCFLARTVRPPRSSLTLIAGAAVSIGMDMAARKIRGGNVSEISKDVGLFALFRK